VAAHRKSFSMDHPVVITFLIFAIIGFMYFAGEVLKPLALAILLSFALVPIAKFLERRGVPRALAVVLTVLLVLGGLGFVGYKVGQQLNLLANDLPKYEDNINRKIKGMKPSQATTIDKVGGFVGDVTKQLSPAKDGNVQEVRIVSEPDFAAQLEKTAGPYLAGLGTGFIILILLLFMMINREDMSDRVIRVFGRGKISLTTRTIEEVGRRISKYLVMFAAMNTGMGTVIGLGLWAVGVPYALLWGFLAGALRFIPYAGPATAFALPMLFSVASSEDWRQPLMILAVYAVVEVAANMFLEPVIYGKTTGVSALALLVSAMFWTWLWGALGLLLSTPLTVSLAVLGKYVPSLGFFATFLREEVDLDPGVRFYQRLLAMDQDGATAVIDAMLKKHPRAEVFDKVLIPTLSMAERDFAREDIDEREQAFIFRVTNDVLADLAGEPEIDLASLSTASAAVDGARPLAGPIAADAEPVAPPKILALPANDATDALVLRLLGLLLEPSGLSLSIVDEVATPLKIVERIAADEPDLVLISHLPPDGLTAARYLVRRIRARHARVPILVGRWDEVRDAEEATDSLIAAGATAVLSSLADARDHLVGLAHPKKPATTGAPSLADPVLDRAGV